MSGSRSSYTEAVTIGSLFSGIGGLELGLERAGLGPVLWQCEIDPFCRAVLAKHWPNVTRFEDVTRPRNYPAVDLICGGFPCQDVSDAGARRGLGGERSGLWWHFARVIAQVRPRFVVVENVAGGAARMWLPAVRGQLCKLGYGARAFRISAADIGAPHLRKRVFVVAHLVARRRAQKPIAVEPCAAIAGLLPTLTAKANMLSPSMQKWAAHRRLPTLTRRDEKGPGPAGHTKGGRDLPQSLGGHLSADWCRWFMGFPAGWLDVDDAAVFARSATPSSRSARKPSGGS